MLDDAFATARGLYWEKGSRILSTIACLFIIPLIIGYVVELWKGGKPHVEELPWGRLFIDGIKLLVIQLIYLIPLILVVGIFFLALLFPFRYIPPQDFLQMIPALMVGLVLFVVLYVIIVLLSTIGNVRFARTGKMGEAFNFGAIIEHIGKIGWIRYIWLLIVLDVVILLSVAGLLMYSSSMVVAIVWIILYPGVIIFCARYISLVYDSAALTPPA
jgi:hypothetical protein